MLNVRLWPTNLASDAQIYLFQSVSELWRKQWEATPNTYEHHLVSDPTVRQPGFDLPKKHWALLNRFRTGQGSCAAIQHQWFF